jgi:hypothetical protein
MACEGRIWPFRPNAHATLTQRTNKNLDVETRCCTATVLLVRAMVKAKSRQASATSKGEEIQKAAVFSCTPLAYVCQIHFNEESSEL